MEIIVKKVKVTKSVISQMVAPSLDVLKNGDVLGMVVNVVKDQHKTMLFAHNNEFYKVAMDWKSGESSMYRKWGRWSYSWKFNSPEECKEFWDNYSRCVSIAESKHLYI
jgi:hypothetical protein